jgi:hypothetical protein
MFCTMKDAIFGCMWGRPNTNGTPDSNQDTLEKKPFAQHVQSQKQSVGYMRAQYNRGNNTVSTHYVPPSSHGSPPKKGPRQTSKSPPAGQRRARGLSPFDRERSPHRPTTLCTFPCQYALPRPVRSILKKPQRGHYLIEEDYFEVNNNALYLMLCWCCIRWSPCPTVLGRFNQIYLIYLTFFCIIIFFLFF